MKINNDEQRIQGYLTDKAARSSEKSQAGFNSILEGTIAKTNAAEKEAQPQSMIAKAVDN